MTINKKHTPSFLHTILLIIISFVVVTVSLPCNAGTYRAYGINGKSYEIFGMFGPLPFIDTLTFYEDGSCNIASLVPYGTGSYMDLDVSFLFSISGAIDGSVYQFYYTGLYAGGVAGAVGLGLVSGIPVPSLFIGLQTGSTSLHDHVCPGIDHAFSILKELCL